MYVWSRFWSIARGNGQSREGDEENTCWYNSRGESLASWRKSWYCSTAISSNKDVQRLMRKDVPVLPLCPIALHLLAGYSLHFVICSIPKNVLMETASVRSFAPDLVRYHTCSLRTVSTGAAKAVVRAVSRRARLQHRDIVSTSRPRSQHKGRSQRPHPTFTLILLRT